MFEPRGNVLRRGVALMLAASRRTNQAAVPSRLAGAVAVAVLCMAVGSAQAGGRCGEHRWCDPSLPAETRAELVLEAMTRDEKLQLMAGDDVTGLDFLVESPSGVSLGVPRLGVPDMYFADGPVGIRDGVVAHDGGGGGVFQGPATALPSAEALAASFDPELAEGYGAMIGDETKKKGSDVLLGAYIEIVRNPLWGRTFEVYGEDPHLSATITPAFNRGVQTTGVIDNTKTYTGNNQEGREGGNRFTVSAEIDERTLREIYLPAAEAAVKESRTGSIMCAYNRVNGVPMCEHGPLLQDVLKDEWGFDGFVLTDWGAARNGVNSANNGLDLEMHKESD